MTADAAGAVSGATEARGPIAVRMQIDADLAGSMTPEQATVIGEMVRLGVRQLAAEGHEQ